MPDRVEARFAVGSGEAVQKHSGRTRMLRTRSGALDGYGVPIPFINLRARPEDTVFRGDPLVSNAGVVGGAAGAGSTEFVEDRPGIGHEELTAPQFLGDGGQRFCVGSHV